MTIQAPCVNFVTAMITMHEPGGQRPDRVWTDTPDTHPGWRSPQPVPDHAGLREREGEEDADRVERDEGVRLPVEDDKQATLSTARMRMPFENASRSPRFANWRGMNPSRARKEATRGKSAKLVLAARIRIRVVTACTR